MRMWLGLLSRLFANINVPVCQDVVRNLIFKCMCRLEQSGNDIIKEMVYLLLSDVRYRSKMFSNIMCICVPYNV